MSMCFVCLANMNYSATEIILKPYSDEILCSVDDKISNFEFENMIFFSDNRGCAVQYENDVYHKEAEVRGKESESFIEEVVQKNERSKCTQNTKWNYILLVSRI